MQFEVSLTHKLLLLVLNVKQHSFQIELSMQYNLCSLYASMLQAILQSYVLYSAADDINVTQKIILC